MADVAQINPKWNLAAHSDDPISFVGMAQLSDVHGCVMSEDTRKVGDVRTGFTPFERGDLLVAKITPCFENGKIGRATIGNRWGAGSTEFHVVRANAALDPAYALHFLRRKEFRSAGKLRMTGSGGQQRVPASYVSEVKIPLPPLEEQRRIAAVLDKADQLRAQRRQALAHLDALTQSIFDDLVKGSSSWPSVSMESLAAPTKSSIRTGPFGSQLLTSEFTDEGIAVLGIDNAVQNSFQWKQRRFISEEKYGQLKRYTVHPGDLIVTIMGTLGRAAVIPDAIPTAINTKHLCCITLNRTLAVPEYIHAYFLQHPKASRHLRQTTKGSIMGGLNMGIIKSMPISLPPVKLQQTFAMRVAAVEHLKDQHRTELAELDTLFASLQNRAFEGEL
ncbi:restriction endonuclease subunit S [Paenarthrobacter sp. PH39-S1]|uniref:restriction endonuclease subunit S n=1 Tax=Paenarthrobacter sp. PH39-S1 TaxID=3046204 RepID=UPI0024B9B17B|nr:restriction endonuclease subunit S [Paenarthrobacter sp. PH39-S1]MDJ0355059.1 restriction endonuclease subunit S [Paenarthrobacter sp. PH39-S1]